MIETFFMCALFGVFIMRSFTFGVKVGQSTARGEKVEIKTPIQVIKEHNDNKKQEEKENINDVMLRNIDAYDGTGFGQEEIR